MSRKVLFLAVTLLTLAGWIMPAAGQEQSSVIAPDPATEIAIPTAWTQAVQDVDAVDRVITTAPDMAAIRAEDELRDASGEPPRFAVPNPVLMTPSTAGTWEALDGQTQLWRLRITCPGAESINLGFTRYFMPAGGQLILYSVDGVENTRAFTSIDNFDHGQLWTPVVLSDDIVVELTIPESVIGDLQLELGAINHGYRFFHKDTADEPRAPGYCEIDVICPDADGWRTEIPAIGAYSLEGWLTCTGFMVNNTALNQTPYFQTAYHCGITSSNASTVVVYWNYYSPTCGAHGGGSKSQYQSGSTFKARWSTSDFCLVQLNASPNPAWKITFAGWDRTDTNTANPVAIHHPDVAEKSISFTTNSTSITTYLSNTSPGDATHLKVTWLPTATNRGVTEGGSSGSPIFNVSHRVLGQLHGGYSACGASDMRDWYGRFYRSWTGGGTNSTRLSNWLDPGSTGATTLDTLNPYADTTPPTPNPMTFASAPAPASSTSIAMTANTATDATSPPVSYFFDFVSGGAGGTDSAWQAGTTYTDTGLTPNTSYTYAVKARDSAATPNETSYSSNFSAVTWANVPTAPSLSGATRGTIGVNVNVNGNPTSTEFAVQCTAASPSDSTWVGKYVNASGAPSASAVWRTDAQWATTTVTGLEGCTNYTFAVKARNSQSVETAFGTGASLSTTGRKGDLNGDNDVDGADIQAFVTCAIAGGDGCGCANMTVQAFVNCLLDAGACP